MDPADQQHPRLAEDPARDIRLPFIPELTIGLNDGLVLCRTTRTHWYCDAVTPTHAGSQEFSDKVA